MGSFTDQPREVLFVSPVENQLMPQQMYQPPFHRRRISKRRVCAFVAVKPEAKVFEQIGEVPVIGIKVRIGVFALENRMGVAGG